MELWVGEISATPQIIISPIIVDVGANKDFFHNSKTSPGSFFYTPPSVCFACVFLEHRYECAQIIITVIRAKILVMHIIDTSS